MKLISDKRFMKIWSQARTKGRLRYSISRAFTGCIPIIMPYVWFASKSYYSLGFITPDLNLYIPLTIIAFLIITNYEWNNWYKNEDRYHQLTKEGSV